MAFDGIVTRAITTELSKELTSARILKIYQPTETELVFQIRNNRENKQLLLSAHSNYARIHLTNIKHKNPAEPPMFCMVLRKHLIGSFIEEIVQYKNERIIKISFRGTDEIGDEVRKALMIELMGKHSNIILIDQDKGHIVDSIKHISPYQSRYRTVLPGQDYIFPPDQEKMDPFTTNIDQIKTMLNEETEPSGQTFVQSFMGISPLVGNEAFLRSDSNSNEDVANTFQGLIDKAAAGDFNPVIFREKREDYHVFDLKQFTGEKEYFDNVNELLDTFYSDKAGRDLVKQKVGDLNRLMKNELDKNKRKIKKQQSDLKKAERADVYQKRGELLTAHLYLVNKGDPEITVVDYYDPNQKEMTIKLDPNKTPSENAQNFFKRYQKLKKSTVELTREIRKAKMEIDYFERLLQQLETAHLDDIEEIRSELREEGYLKVKRVKNKRKQKLKKPSPEQFQATDGTVIYVGKNNKQNDYLISKMANRNDIWLHTKDIPGSHVLIRSESPSEDTLAEAAQLAAIHSKASGSSSVPVDYTQARHVKKPNGAKPGFVIYEQEKTLFVTPNRAIVDTLKKQ